MAEPPSNTAAGEAAAPGAAVPPEEQAGPADEASLVGPDVAELEDRWRRALADLDNLRKRYARELGRERAAERELVTAAFLPVLDNIDRAVGLGGRGPAARLRRPGPSAAAGRGDRGAALRELIDGPRLLRRARGVAGRRPR
jgi:hypothetical protein